MTLRILIVEDNQVKRQRYYEVFDRANVPREQIDEAKSISEARDCLQLNVYDLMILDIILPNVVGGRENITGGIDLLEELDALSDRYVRPPVIVGVTAHEELSEKYQHAFSNRVQTLLQFDPTLEEWAERLGQLVHDLQQAKRSQQEQASRFSFVKDVCVITALTSPELRAVRDIREWNFCEEARMLNADTFYYEGIIQAGNRRFSVVASTAKRMGLVAAALHAQKVIQAFRPRILIMVGICGGVSGRVDLGDVILADPAWEWQSGKRIADGDGFDFLSEPHQLSVDPRISARFDQFIEDAGAWARIRSGWRSGGNEPGVLKGVRAPVASGSAVLADGHTVTALKEEQHRKLTGIEMEIYGVYAAAQEFPIGRPLTFAMKGVSDLADTHKADDFQAYAAYTSAQAMRIFLETNIAAFIDMQDELVGVSSKQNY